MFKCFTNSNTFDLQNSSVRKVLLLASFCRIEKLNTERLRNLLKVTQLVNLLLRVCSLDEAKSHLVGVLVFPWAREPTGLQPDELTASAAEVALARKGQQKA